MGEQLQPSRAVQPSLWNKHYSSCTSTLFSADEPGSSLTSRTRVKTLAYDTIIGELTRSSSCRRAPGSESPGC